MKPPYDEVELANEQLIKLMKIFYLSIYMLPPSFDD
jgi:hypothetical protein